MRKLQGVIVSDKMNRTVVVRVDRLARHPKYQKYVRTSRRFKADTGGSEYHVGDDVVIQEARPLSREKKWRIVELVKRGQSEDNQATDI